VNLLPIDGPKTEWSSPLEAFEDAFKHEQVVSKRIHDLLALAIEVKDYPTQEFLQWFVKEQVEEEATADSIVKKLQLIGDSKNALFMLDHALGERGE
jgi:ferritin